MSAPFFIALARGCIYNYVTNREFIQSILIVIRVLYIKKSILTFYCYTD